MDGRELLALAYDNPLILGVLSNFIYAFLTRRGMQIGDAIWGKPFERALQRTLDSLSTKYEPLDSTVFRALMSTDNVNKAMNEYALGHSFDPRVLVEEFRKLPMIDLDYWSREKTQDLIDDFFAVLRDNVLRDAELAHFYQTRLLEKLAMGSAPSSCGPGGDIDSLRHVWEHLFRRDEHSLSADILLEVIPKLIQAVRVQPSEGARRNLRFAKHLGEEVLRVQPGRADLYLCLGALEHALNNWCRASNYYQQALTCATRDRYRLQALLGIGAMNFNMGNYDVAKRVFGEMCSSPSAVDEPDLRIRAERYLGWVSMNQGNYELACDTLRRNLKEAPIVGDPLFESDAYHILGRLYHQMGRSDEGLKMLREALRIKERANAPPIIMAPGFHRMAECYLGMDKEQSAREYLSEALSLFQYAGSEDGAGLIHLDIAKVLIRGRKLIPAQEQLLQPIKTFEDMGYARGLADSLYCLGVVYEGRSLYEEAVCPFLRSMRIYRQMRMPECSMAMSALGQIRTKLGDKKYRSLARKVE
jgi:tetratricopeptide (TPR) repeat protein